ncbi:protein Mabiki [Glossina fuscipes]|uniref:Protein Mabiki n=1 Tax=Glossina fuscipes TaxID=7396 RepID=A0A8U0W9S9_9MUSC|nr:protein Mabiki [Glossina fuscipes]KAI9586033.1 hypothetical protein GQX74_001880 [Glossina fuscipes]
MQSCASEPLVPEAQYRHKKFDIHKKSSPAPSPIGISTADDAKTHGESVMNESLQDKRKKRLCESKDSNQISLETYVKVKEKLDQELSSCDELPMPALKRFRKCSLSSKAVTNPPTIEEETLKKICEHQERMKRKFPTKERSAKEQERRNKNTESCRITRKMTKLKQIVIEEEYKTDYEENMKIKEKLTRTYTYLNVLLRLKNGDRDVLETIPKE